MSLLSPKQAGVWRSYDEPNRWTVLMGAVRSGKTYIGYLGKAKRLRRLPRGNVFLIGKTQQTYCRNVLDPMREMYGGDYIGQLSGKGVVRLFGGPCYVVGANDARAVMKIQGAGMVYCDGDEFPTWPENFFGMLKSRLSDAGACCDLTGNPEGPMHWAKKCIDTTPRLRYFHFQLDDNPFLTPETVAAIKAEHTGIWYDRAVLGLWVAAQGVIYDMLSSERHVVDALPEMSAYYVGTDYDTAGVTCFWLLGIGTDNRLYFVDFWRWDAKQRQRQLSDHQIGDELNKWLASLEIRPKDIVIPHDAASFAVHMQQARHAKLYSHVSGLAWADQSPHSVILGIRDVSTLLSRDMLLFSREVERKGGLAEWSSYTWDPKTDESGEDTPLKKDDHDVDSGRGVVMYVKTIWSKWLYATADATSEMAA